MSGPSQPEPTPPPGVSPKAPAADEDLYSVADPQEAAASRSPEPSPGGSGNADAPAWYVGLADGRREGPLPLATVRQRIMSGAISRKDLVWREGMSGWTPAGEVAALFPKRAGPAGPTGSSPPPPLHARESRPEPDDAAEPWRIASADVMRRCDSIFARPTFFRMFGRAAAVLGLFMLLVALIAAMAGKGSLFVYVFWFVLLFLVGEATAAILEGLDRGEQGNSGQGPQSLR